MSRILEDEILRSVRQLRNGSEIEASSREIFGAFYPRIYRFFLRKGFSRTQAEDLAQDTLFQVFEKIGDFQEASTLTAWIFAIAANLVRNARRHSTTIKRRGEELSLTDDERGGREVPVLTTARATPEEAASHKEQTVALKQAIGRLPSRRRQCVELQLQGFKIREIAALLTLELGTVKAHLSQAREQLRREIGGRWRDGD